MEKIFRLDTWKVFALIILPLLFPDSEFGFCLDFAYLIFCLCWYYYLAYELFIRLPEEHDMNFNKFKFHFFFPLIYFSIAIFFTGGGYSITLNNMDKYGPTGDLMVALHLFSMYCIFYCLYFIARILVIVKRQEDNLKISDYIGYFFALWLMPIGIWFIQPVLKQIFIAEEDNNS